MTEQKRLWFRARRYGWGWTPITWEGWLALLIYVLALVPIVRNIIALSNAHEPLDAIVILAIGRVFLLTLALLIVCYLKGEKPHWSWGEK